MSVPDEVCADERLARAAWSCLTEPGDPVAGAVRARLGARGSLRWAREAMARPEPAAQSLLTAVGVHTPSDVSAVRRAVARLP